MLQVLNFLEVSLAQSVIYMLAIWLAKLTIVILLLHIFGVDRRFRLVSWIIIISWTIWAILDICLVIFECNPIKKAWNPSLPGHCIDLITIGVANGYINIVYASPFIVARRLHLKLTRSNRTLSCSAYQSRWFSNYN